MANEPQLILPKGDGVHSVVIPCDPQEFSNFIASLLGKKQSIRRSIDGPFDIDLHHIKNYTFLLEQRIAAQNSGSLASFSATLSLENNTDVTLNSVHDFEGFHPVDNSIVVSLNMNWKFLIRFPDKSIPELQEINVFIATSRGLAMRRRSDPSPRIDITDASPSAEEVEIRISYTDRTWAIDILNLLTNHARTASVRESGFSKIGYRNRNLLALILFLVTWVCGCVILYKLNLSAIAATQREFRDGIQALSPDFAGIRQAFIRMGDALPTLLSPDSGWIIGVGFTGTVILLPLAFLMTHCVWPTPQSYMVLTDIDKKYRRWDQEKRKRNIAIGIIGVLGTLAFDVFSHFITTVITEHFF